MPLLTNLLRRVKRFLRKEPGRVGIPESERVDNSDLNGLLEQAAQASPRIIHEPGLDGEPVESMSEEEIKEAVAETWSPGASADEEEVEELDSDLPDVEDEEEHITGAIASNSSYDDTGRASEFDLDINDPGIGGSALTLQHRTDLTLRNALEHQRQHAVVITKDDIARRNEEARARAREAVADLTGNQTHVFRGQVRSDDNFVRPRGAEVSRNDPIRDVQTPSSVFDHLVMDDDIESAPQPRENRPTRMQILRGKGSSYDAYELHEENGSPELDRSSVPEDGHLSVGHTDKSIIDKNDVRVDED